MPITGKLFARSGSSTECVRAAFVVARKRAGLGEDVTFHTLRHTFASWYMMNAGDLYRLQRYLGHSTMALTQRYAHLSPDYMKAGVEFIGPPRRHTVCTSADSAGKEAPATA